MQPIQLICISPKGLRVTLMIQNPSSLRYWKDYAQDMGWIAIAVEMKEVA